MGLVFSISNFFINKTALANIWMNFSCSNLALEELLKNYFALMYKIPTKADEIKKNQELEEFI